jgi:hypothetical protein
MKFMYTTGQRPLEGFTVKRGIGKGGFGEVYFAVSDGGKEVALKLLRDNSDIELRGVAQCLNLKHPHLVALYDLRTDARADHWVVMEYIAGESLGAVLGRHSEGLAAELTREWFLALARAVAYLHDHGIVHRDLKPANIFLETGVLKVGDYGLSKAISTSQHTAQTQSVGTVHYMAPEISTGNYNKSVDVYAAGIILYEMLTGHVPFDGESAGEILMKHLTSPPDLSRVPAAYVPILSRALAKNPAQRYATLAEMAADVEGIGRPAAANAVAPVLPARRPGAGPPEAMPLVPLRGLVAELCTSMILAVLFAGLGATLWAAISKQRELTDLGAIFFITVLASWAILVPGKFWALRRGDSWTRRMALLLIGAVVGLGAVWVDGWPLGVRPPASPGNPDPGAPLSSLVPSHVMAEVSYLSYFALAFFALRWWRLTDPRRPQRFGFAPLFAAGFWGVVLWLLVWPQPWHGPAALVLTAAIVQLVSRWEPPPPPPARRLRFRCA